MVVSCDGLEISIQNDPVEISCSGSAKIDDFFLAETAFFSLKVEGGSVFGISSFLLNIVSPLINLGDPADFR